MGRVNRPKQEVNFEKTIPKGMRWGICTRCKKPYLTYFKENTICDIGKCFEIGQDRKRGIE